MIKGDEALVTGRVLESDKTRFKNITCTVDDMIKLEKVKEEKRINN